MNRPLTKFSLYNITISNPESFFKHVLDWKKKNGTFLFGNTIPNAPTCSLDFTRGFEIKATVKLERWHDHDFCKKAQKISIFTTNMSSNARGFEGIAEIPEEDGGQYIPKMSSNEKEMLYNLMNGLYTGLYPKIYEILASFVEYSVYPKASEHAAFIKQLTKEFEKVVSFIQTDRLFFWVNEDS